MIGIPINCVRLTTVYQSGTMIDEIQPPNPLFDINVLVVRNFADEKKPLDLENNIQYIIYKNHNRLKHLNT
jgi:hypothetical protein